MKNMLRSTTPSAARNNKGAISLGCLVTLILLAAAGWHGYLFGIPYYHNSRFQDGLFDLAEQTYRQRTNVVIEKIIAAAALEKIKLEENNITYTEGYRDVDIQIVYDVQVETPFITRTLHMKAIATRKFTR